MKPWWNSFKIAFSMYSKVPMPKSEWTKENMRYIMCLFPLIGVIIGEFLAAKAGLGYLIIYGSQVFKLDWVMLSIFILCIIAMVLYKILNILEKYAEKNI